MDVKEFEQKQYEKVLAAHWHKISEVKEMMLANRSLPKSALRERLIVGYRNEIDKIENQKVVLEQLSTELKIPEWYTKKIKELRW
jgi:hypothetical protein